MNLYVITPPPDIQHFPFDLTCEVCDRPIDQNQVFFKSFVISVGFGVPSMREHGYWMSICDGCGDLTVLNDAVQVSR